VAAVDSAYGGFAVLCAEVKARLNGIGLADSVMTSSKRAFRARTTQLR
jgi:glutamate/tyrosine decarboxylase-like PLP-dependent enzyme